MKVMHKHSTVYRRKQHICGFKCVLEPMIHRHGRMTVLDFNFFWMFLIQSQKSLWLRLTHKSTFIWPTLLTWSLRKLPDEDRSNIIWTWWWSQFYHHLAIGHILLSVQSCLTHYFKFLNIFIFLLYGLNHFEKPFLSIVVWLNGKSALSLKNIMIL